MTDDLGISVLTKEAGLNRANNSRWADEILPWLFGCKVLYGWLRRYGGANGTSENPAVRTIPSGRGMLRFIFFRIFRSDSQQVEALDFVVNQSGAFGGRQGGPCLPCVCETHILDGLNWHAFHAVYPDMPWRGGIYLDGNEIVFVDVFKCNQYIKSR